MKHEPAILILIFKVLVTPKSQVRVLPFPPINRRSWVRIPSSPLFVQKEAKIQVFEFEIEWCDSEEMLINRGLVAGVNFQSAMRRVLEYFGEECKEV